METMLRRTPRRRKSSGARNMLLFLIIILAAGGGWFVYDRYIPNFKQTIPDYGVKNPIVVHGEVMKQGAIIENNEVKLPLPVLQQVLGADQPIRYEADSGSIILTTANKVLRLQTNSLTATVNRKPFDLTITAEVQDDVVYIPITPIEELYGLQTEYAADSGVVTLLQSGEAIQLAEAKREKGAAIRTEPTIRAPIVEKVPLAGKLRVWGESDGWLLVQGPDGHPGYMAKDNTALASMEQIAPSDNETDFVAWKVTGSKINLTWEAVYQRKPDPATIPEMQGVNVVSPTWFELQDEDGTIKGKADPVYVKWAKEQKMQVWALFSNGFEPDRTSAALATVETRFHMIQQLLAFAELYHLQGINVDFENVYTKDKENLVQFVRELTPLLHEAGLVVSIDVTPKSNSEMWSVFLDRKALGKVVDYMMVMAYDEHWATSPVAGSVASLPWTEQALKRILDEDAVPASKLILSMPLYTRIWTETEENGETKVSSKALGMDKVKEIITQYKLKPVLDRDAGQHYVEYKEEEALKRIWIEDELSIKARVALVKKYGLAGVATWQRTFQTNAIWKTIDTALNKKT
ncbi:glycosyl hydrolase [Paenibacillus sp. BIHB 4019]|uniref:Glycosyl hydrolase n=2 Tax=Paenibacillus sp. BIHB 4019 TaxID=1870819 RepID=A0A1B2DIZ6_9BACL|nr:glycosyl hydrolase [Paenibacillus sp. BIHB 4019]